MSTNQTDQVTVLAQTTNAVLTTILTYVQPDGSGIFSEAIVQARDTSGNTKGWNMLLVSERVSGGGATTVGALQSLMTAQGDAGLATALATVVTSGNNILVQVTGIAVTTINWRVRFIADIHVP